MSPIFEQVGHLQAQVTGIRGVGKPRFHLDDAGANVLLDLVVEGLHPVFRAVAHRIEQRFPFDLAFFDVLARPQRGFQYLDDGHAADAIFARKQALGNDVTERFVARRSRMACSITQRRRRR